MKTEWKKQAAFSACRQYRWWLTRTRAEGAGTVVFAGLNPSIAGADSDDPTCKRGVPELAARVMQTPAWPCFIACFGRNKNGTPKHPLYLPKNCQLEPFA